MTKLIMMNQNIINENEKEITNNNFDDETNSSKSHIINENEKEITNEIEITNNNFTEEILLVIYI